MKRRDRFICKVSFAFDTILVPFRALTFAFSRTRVSVRNSTPPDAICSANSKTALCGCTQHTLIISIIAVANYHVMVENFSARFNEFYLHTSAQRTLKRRQPVLTARIRRRALFNNRCALFPSSPMKRRLMILVASRIYEGASEHFFLASTVYGTDQRNVTTERVSMPREFAGSMCAAGRRIRRRGHALRAKKKKGTRCTDLNVHRGGALNALSLEAQCARNGYHRYIYAIAIA